jgi:hypothetical protein
MFVWILTEVYPLVGLTTEDLFVWILTEVYPLVGLTTEDFIIGQATIKVVSSKVVKHKKACFGKSSKSNT